MSSFHEFKLFNHILIKFYYILIFIKFTSTDEFIELKKLSISNNYFIVLDTGLYLYDLTNENENEDNCTLIHKFNEDEYRISNNIMVTELYYRYKAYIFCLVNEYLFIFNEYTYKLIKYKIKEIKEIINFNNNDYCNIIPYKIENNIISFIIAINNDSSNLIFYYYNFNFNEGINNPKVIIFNDMNIQNKKIRCQINSYFTFIICFYYSIINDKNKIFSSIFLIKNMNLILKSTSEIFYDGNFEEINQIKFAMTNNDKFFVCFLNNINPVCFINDNNYTFTDIGCEHSKVWTPYYKIYFFNETNEFMIISKTHVTKTILNNYDNSLKECENVTMSSKQDNFFSIIYNNGYQTINYTNFLNYMHCYDISKLEINKLPECIEEIKYFINNTQNKEEIILNLNEYMKNTMSINYIDENQELIIQKDEMTIAFTSTYIQKINENSNSTTINLGKCEKELKYIYNISDESNLYMLKIDTKQEGKNYPLIEYEVFYPLNDGNIELLNLSYCKDIDIEISIPIIINDTIDKYNPKSNYYNDICTKANSKCNTDIPLNDRRNEFINKNMSLCENNCELIDYDNNNKNAKCSCKVKTSLSLDKIELDRKNILKDFIDIKKITNIEIIKCYKIVFKINNLKNNYGFFLIFFIFILYFICICIFYFKSLKNLIDEVIKIIEAKNLENQIIKSEQIYPLKNKNKVKKINKKNKKAKNKIKSDSTLKKLKKENSKVVISKNNILQKNIENEKIINKNEKCFTQIKKEKGNNILEYTDSELNSLSFEEALKIDKRTYCQYYFSLLKKKNSILFSFYPIKDYNSQIIKSFLFFFFLVSDITVNALFFTDDTMHKIYVDSGSFNLNYQLPQIVYSYLISSLINYIIEFLPLSEETIISIKTSKNINIDLSQNLKQIHLLKIKFFLFFIITFVLLSIFGYYISCFCCIYQNTQIHLFKDSLISLGFSLIFPFFTNLIPGIFRFSSLRNIKGDKICLYKFSKFIEYIML